MGKNNRQALFAAVFAVVGLAGAARAEDVVIHAGTLLDGVSKTPRTQVSILIHDDRVVSVSPGYTNPAGARVIDLSNATVLPGLIDCHVHITSQSDGGDTVHEAVTRTRLVRPISRPATSATPWRRASPAFET